MYHKHNFEMEQSMVPGTKLNNPCDSIKKQFIPPSPLYF